MNSSVSHHGPVMEQFIIIIIIIIIITGAWGSVVVKALRY